MKKKEIIPILQWIVEALSKEEYEQVVSSASKSRLSSGVVRDIISDYPVTLSIPPFETYKKAVFIKTNDNSYHVDFSLWSQGALSDLTLSCSFEEVDSKIVYSIEDLHVM